MHVILHLKKLLQIETKTKTLQGGEPQKGSNSVCPLAPAHPAPPDPAAGAGHPGEQKSLVGRDCVIRITCPAVDAVIIFLCFLQCLILYELVKTSIHLTLLFTKSKQQP